MQVPSFPGHLAGAPAAFAGHHRPPARRATATPLTEDDSSGTPASSTRSAPGLTVSADAYYELTDHYLDTGQFGVVPIFAPFNYAAATSGARNCAAYRAGASRPTPTSRSAETCQKGVATGQFNFDRTNSPSSTPTPSCSTTSHWSGASAGATWDWSAWLSASTPSTAAACARGFADRRSCRNGVPGERRRAARLPLPGVGEVTNRLTVLNLFDRTNLIRPAEGIGIFQSAYGPRFTVLIR